MLTSSSTLFLIFSRQNGPLTRNDWYCADRFVILRNIVWPNCSRSHKPSIDLWIWPSIAQSKAWQSRVFNRALVLLILCYMLIVQNSILWLRLGNFTWYSSHLASYLPCSPARNWGYVHQSNLQGLYNFLRPFGSWIGRRGKTLKTGRLASSKNGRIKVLPSNEFRLQLLRDSKRHRHCHYNGRSLLYHWFLKHRIFTSQQEWIILRIPKVYWMAKTYALHSRISTHIFASIMPILICWRKSLKCLWEWVGYRENLNESG